MLAFNYVTFLADAQCIPGSRPLHLTDNGTFTSPGYPDNSSNYADCQWQLRAATTNGVGYRMHVVQKLLNSQSLT
jgi:hypothetical protein